jgi:serine/arginine repetitive matrix protein 2
MMSGGLPAGTLSSHVQDQFPGQNPQQFAPPFVPHAPVHTASFGEAANYYGDQGESVHHQPGVRMERPAVIIPHDQQHLITGSAHANPVADTGTGAAAEFFAMANDPSQQPSKPPRPSSMPGAFTDDEPLLAKPPRPSSKLSKPGKLSSAATLAGAAGMGYTVGHESSHVSSHQFSHTHSQQTTTYTNGVSGGSASMFYQGENPSTAATDGSHNYNGTSSYIPTYTEGMEGIPPPKPPRPGNPEKQPSGSSHAGLYTAGAAGLAAYGLAHHNSHSHTHTHTHTHPMPGGFPGEHYNGHDHGHSPSALMSGGMAQRHEHKGPVSKFADWWKNHDDVRRMEEYTEYIGVCKYCFDPRSSPMDAPRQHHYNRRRRSGELRPSGIKEKHSRYGLHEKASRTSLSGDERRDTRKNNSSSAAGWIAAGLGGVGLAKAGQALFNQRNDFDDTYSIKSGRDPRSRTSRRSRSRSRESKHYSYGRSGIRHRSPSEDRVSFMSTGITGNHKVRKDHKIVRHRSRSQSRSHSRDRKSGILGAALGAGLAASAVGASRRKHHSQSRSRSHSPQNVFVHHRRNSSDRERRYSKNQRLKSKSSRSSVSGASFVDVSRTQQAQGGFLGGFFAAAPPKDRSKQKRRKTHTHSKKKKGFFNFGNASSSSSDSDIAFGEGFVRSKKRPEKRPSRRSSDEKFNAALLGLGATAAAIAAAKAGRNHGRNRPEVVAVRENRHQTQSRYRRQSGTSRYGDIDADGWEDLPDEDTTDSGSVSSGLAFGDHSLYKTKSKESLNSNGSGTSKWGWRWGSKKQKKKPSTESLYNANANSSLIGSAAVGTIAGAAIGAGLHRQDSSASSIPSLQNVVPVQATTDPNSFDARRTNSLPTPQPLLTSQSGHMILQHPQPLHQVPGAMYSAQAPPQSEYVVPGGPPVFSHPPYPTAFDSPQHPAPPRRVNSSPVQSSSWKRDAAIAATAGGLAGAAISSLKNRDRPSSSQSNVRFGFTEEQARKERERLKDHERVEEEERRRRLDETERKEQERRKLELQRQQEEARKYQEAEQFARLEAERREQEERIARRTREKVEEQERREHEARVAEQRRRELELEEEQKHRERLEQEHRMAEQRRRDLEFEQELEQKRQERRELDRRAAERREAEQREAEQREAEIQQDLERRRREREAEEYSSRYESDRERRVLEQQRTGSSVASDVRRKERELEDRERDIVQPDVWKKPAAAVTAAVAAAVITNTAISSSKRDERRTKSEQSSQHDDRVTKVIEPSPVKTIEPAAVKTIAPSMVAVDYADDDIFNPDIFKKRWASPIRQPGSAQEVLQEWEDRYTSKHEQVSQADFFAPKELLDKTAAPVAKIDPNEGAPDLHIYQAHDEHDFGPPRQPPYPTSYSFTATKDGRGPLNPPYPVPELNLIQPTPPGSRAPTPRVVSIPPSPAIEPVTESKQEEPKQDEANRRSSRVSWGANQFHNYEVHTPDAVREQFVSDRDLEDHSGRSQDQIYVESDSPKSGRKITTYRADDPSLPEPEIPASTQYVPDQDNDDWAGTMSKKVSKKDKKKTKAAAVAAAATAVTAAAIAIRDDEKPIRARDDADNMSIMTDPFADKYAASTISVAPSTISSWSTPFSESASDVTVIPAKPKGSIAREITSEPEPMHMPGGFDDSSAPTTEAPTEDEWAVPGKKSKKGKKAKSTEEDTFAVPEPPRAFDPVREPEPEPVREVLAEPGTKSSKKDKKKKKKSMSLDEDSYARDTPSAVVPEPAPAIVEERKPEPEVLAEDDWSASAKSSKKDKKKKSKGATEEFFDQPSPNTFDSRIVSEPEPVKEPFFESEPEKPVEDEWTAPVKTSKKDKKKAKKAARKGVDNVDESESSQPSTPVFERDPRDIEPTFTGDVLLDDSRSNGSSTTATNAAMAGGFAALVGAAMKQDQDRIASDFEHARESMEYARTLPSTAFHDVEELGDVKTPKKKKRASNGRWSPSIGSPLRSEVQYMDYVGHMGERSTSRDAIEASKPASHTDLGLSHVFPATIRDGKDSGYYAPDDPVQPNSADRDSDEFFSAGSDEQRQAAKDESPPSDKYSDREKTSVVSPPKSYDDELDREERRRVRYGARSGSQSRERGYELDKGDSPDKRRHHRRRETDERSDDWESRSVISEARSEATGERRRKHRHRESEGTRSPDEYRRSSAKSDPGDLEDERKSSRRRSKRDDDDNMSVVSSSARDDGERSKKDKEKRSSGLFGLFSRSKESLADTSSKSSKTREDEDDGERRRRRKKHREGSAYGSDDDDARSTISSSSRREKRRSRTDSWDEKV